VLFSERIQIVDSHLSHAGGRVRARLQLTEHAGGPISAARLVRVKQAVLKLVGAKGELGC
jgi:hypothetical protein